MNQISFSYQVGDISYTVSLQLDNDPHVLKKMFETYKKEAEKNGENFRD